MYLFYSYNWFCFFKEKLNLRFFIGFFLNLYVFCSNAEMTTPKDFWQNTKNRLYQIWANGGGDLYIPTYTYHNRFSYDSEHISRLNELPRGAGFGKSLINKHGNWESLYFSVILDSHYDIEPFLGYQYIWLWNFVNYASGGIGYTLVASARSDFNNYTPFALIVPEFMLNYKNVSLIGSYVPGGGDVLLLTVRIGFDS